MRDNLPASGGETLRWAKKGITLPWAGAFSPLFFSGEKARDGIEASAPNLPALSISSPFHMGDDKGGAEK
jgi:hypothetical protein